MKALTFILCTLGTLGAMLLGADAMAQNATPPGSSSGDPINALWALLGTSPVAVVLYAWNRSEKQDRITERTERLAATASKDAMMAKMVELLEADIEHKVELRHRLKGQDDALTKLIDGMRRLEERPPRSGRSGG